MTTILDAGAWRRRMRQLLHHDQHGADQQGGDQHGGGVRRDGSRRDGVRPGCACGDPRCRALVPLIPAPRLPFEPFRPTEG